MPSLLELEVGRVERFWRKTTAVKCAYDDDAVLSNMIRYQQKVCSRQMVPVTSNHLFYYFLPGENEMQWGEPITLINI